MRGVTRLLIMLSIVPLLLAGGHRGAGAQGGGADCELLGLINDLRRDNGLAPLQLSRPLDAAAGMKASDMAERDYMDHVSPDGQGPRELLDSAGYTYRTSWGETLAAGNEGAGATFQQWLNSPPHREIMVGSQFTAVGFGRAYNADSAYGWYWAAEFGGVVGEPGADCGTTSPPGQDALIATLIAILTQILAGA